MNGRRAFVGAVLAACLALTLSACGQSESEAVASAGPAPDPPGPIDAQVGETIERAGVTITLHETGATYSLGSAANADDGRFFISAKTTIDNTGPGERAPNA